MRSAEPAVDEASRARSPARKVLHVVEWLESSAWQTLLSNLGQAQRERGLETAIVSFGPYRYREGFLGAARTYEFGCPIPEGALLYPLLDFVYATFHLLRVLRRERPSVVHLHTMGVARALAFALLPWPLPRLIVTVHGLDFPPGCPGERLKLARLRILLGRAAEVTAVSAFARGELDRRLVRGRRPIRIVPNGVDLEFFGAPAERREPARPYLLSVGHVVVDKGLDVLALAFADLIREGFDLDWVFCGKDLSSGHLQRLVERLGVADRCRFLGHVGRESLRGHLQGCAVFVAPSRYESFGMAVLEAMASGAAVVASRVGGIPELLVDGDNGRLVPPRDPRALRDALRALLRDEPARRRLGRRAAETARSWGWKPAADAYERLYAAA